MNEEYLRLKAIVNEERCCKTCQWCERDEWKDLICVNVKSDKAADWVEEDYICECYESKGKNPRWKKWKK